ncbi:antibiotic biosynthesis monooxygenase family protein [Kitasatospora sp. NPDC101155]|uniref:antibiotic biosynthesis monooxygenase family protein n=1 Tax=Kitasatospora sp. NPDC101155 TaxID=3364097 RepID=UPI0037FD1C47
MIRIDQLDKSTDFMSQLQEKTGPIVLINTFIVPEGKMDEVLAIWEGDAKFMKSCPGFISTQLHRGTGASNTLVNIATWQSTEALLQAFNNPDFKKAASAYPDGMVAYPHVLEKISIDGVCVA